MRKKEGHAPWCLMNWNYGRQYGGGQKKDWTLGLDKTGKQRETHNKGDHGIPDGLSGQKEYPIGIQSTYEILQKNRR